MKILSKQNFNQNESKNFVVDNLSSAPSNPILGQVYYNTQDERAYVCIKAGDTPEWADLSLQEEVSIGGEEPNGRDVKIWINPEDMVSSSDYGSLPIGSIIPYSGETAPEGYSICDGKELNRETYKELFSIIGTTFGNGDGTSTFNLPDLKGRISVGLDSSDTDFDSLGKTGGSKYLQKHSHQQIAFDSWGSGVSATHLGTDALAGMTSSNQAYVGGRSTLEAGTGNSGNLQPYIVLNYIIKIYGEAMLTGDVIDSLEGDSSYNAPSIHAVNTKMKELVAPSYDGLPVGSEIDFDGTEIPDGFIQVDDPNTYSTEEKIIGTWFGKKLYRKVIVKTITKSGNNIFSLSSVGLENIDKYITLKSISNGNPINEDYYTTNADLLRTLINYDGLHIQLGTSYPSVPCLIYTIVEYTKTTD